MCNQIPGITLMSSLTALALGVAWAGPACAQSTPNWGTENTQTSPDPAAGANSSPWGGANAPTPMRGAHSTLPFAREKVETIPPAIAEILKRADADVINLPGRRPVTVREIKAVVNGRRAVIEALKTGKVPATRKLVRVATSRSERHDETLASSKLLRDTARREAAAAWASPGATSSVPATQRNPATAWGASAATSGANWGQGDSAAAWATRGKASAMNSTRRQTSDLAPPVVATELHSGIGNTTVPQSGSAFLRSSKPAPTEISKQPSQDFVAQNLEPGIGIVNGHSKDVRLTPGGLYTVIGSGFGEAVGAADLIGPHLPGGRLGLQITQWSDRKMQVQLAEPISGIADQPVTLRVTTRLGTLFTMNVQFYATRQPITLSGSELDLNQAFELGLGNPNDWDQTSPDLGGIVRTKSGNNIGCPNVGQDSLRTKLPQGWTMIEVAIKSWLPLQGNSNKDFYGDDGDTVVSGSYSITQIPAGITNQTYEVRWGVLRTHSTNGFHLLTQNFEGNDFGWNGDDGCVSEYDIEATLVGPAGLRPW